MKKVLTLLMLVFMSLTFASCNSNELEINIDNTIKYNDIQLYDYKKFSSLPRIDINTKNGIALDDDSLINPNEVKGVLSELPVYDYVDSKITVSNCDGYELNNVTAKVKIRGNYTSIYPKKPIRIKFDKKQSMCGLNNGNKLKSWVLLAEFKDISMLRNITALYLGKALLQSEGYYISDFRYVEVYLNGDYNGLYVLAEQQQVNKYRVDLLEPLNPSDFKNDDLTQEEYSQLHNTKIGYFIEYDGYYFHENPLNKFTIMYDTIKKLDGSDLLPANDEDSTKNPDDRKCIGFSIVNDIYFEEQRDFIANCMQTIWNCIYDAIYNNHNDTSINPYHTMDNEGNYVVDKTILTSYEAISKVVDLKSLVNMYILHEICMDWDISWSSFNFSLDMSEHGNKLLTYIAPWDFDSAFGNFKESPKNDMNFACNSLNVWFTVFSQTPWFWEIVSQRWEEVLNANLCEKTAEMLDYLSQNFKTAFDDNYSKWENLGEFIVSGLNNEVLNFTSQLDASNQLKNWIIERFENITNNLKLLNKIINNKFPFFKINQK